MTLAIFDLDNTLINGDSDYEWGQFLVENGVVDREYHSRINALHFENYKAGKLNIHDFLEFQLEPLKNNSRQFLEELRVDFLLHIIKPMIAENARQLLQHHRNSGHTLMIITATNRFITEPIAQELGIDVLMATEVEEQEGNFTGQTFDIPTFAQGKVKRLRRWLSQNSESLAGSWFYSDSHNDLPLLSIVSHPVAVNPDEILRQEAQSRHWKIIDW